MTTIFSESEKNGLSFLRKSDNRILSLGISTEGYAEIEMARKSNKRKIIATTIDAAGLRHTKKLISENGVAGQVETRLEDIKDKMPYPDSYFDFVYARLVLHYLTREELDKALFEIARVMKPKGRLFAVVRSDKCQECKKGEYDANTGMTSYFIENTRIERRRYFHSEETLAYHLGKAGFNIIKIDEHEERLFKGYMRTGPSDVINYVIEVLAKKTIKKDY